MALYVINFFTSVLKKQTDAFQLLDLSSTE